ncbi:hypothetical protein [Longimicrobium terrae]|uniref:Lipoprotein n=1 Tax=Longimicrobium terrae TaxID=1639882 RepID=A0A841H477_9BACT|nr:hypothetical protein [Longimicrobium terrae]MBB4638333.1 hypothetical protein [Longimicrobium terrae]MBB6072599.1 hypothetical protein [Longimicrobium terrae]NNC28622.1 hypothetical protein [Longimicrobium terrae]
MRTLSIILLGAMLVLASACSEPASKPARQAEAEKIDYWVVPCEPTLSDSARVECNALAAVVKDDGFLSVVTQFRREGTGYCITTYPDHPSIVNGGAVVRLDSAGVVQSVTRGDTIGCSRAPKPVASCDVALPPGTIVSAEAAATLARSRKRCSAGDRCFIGCLASGAGMNVEGGCWHLCSTLRPHDDPPLG